MKEAKAMRVVEAVVNVDNGLLEGNVIAGIAE